MNYRLITSLVLILLTLLFIFQNTSVVEFHFLIWTIAMSRSLMFFLLLGIGFLIGWILRSHIASRHKNRHTR